MDMLAFSYEEVRGALTVVLCLAAFLIGAVALEGLKRADKKRCWRVAEEDPRMQEMLKGDRVAKEEAVKALNEAKAGLERLQKATQGHGDLKKQLSTKKEQNKKNHDRAESAQKRCKDLERQLEQASREAWQLKVELEARIGRQLEPMTRPMGPMEGVDGEHYSRSNGQSHQTGIASFSRR